MIIMNISELNLTTSELILNYEEKIFLATMEMLISLFGIVSNCTIILAVCLSAKLQTRTNVFVVSLSVSDLLSSIGLIPNIIALYGRSGWAIPGHEWFCKFGAFLLLTCLGVSLYNLSCIALLRMLLITRPATYRKIYSPRVTFAIVFIAWFIPLVIISVPTSVGVGGYGYEHADTTCTDLDQLPNADTFNLIQSLSFFPGPLIVTLLCYTRTFIFLKKHFDIQVKQVDVTNATVASTSDTELNKSHQRIRDKNEDRKMLLHKQEYEITKNLFLVVVVFILCFTPYWMAVVIPGGEHVVLYTGVILGFHVFVNPFIYSLKHPHFKVVVKAVIRRKWQDIPEPSKLLRYIVRE